VIQLTVLSGTRASRVRLRRAGGARVAAAMAASVMVVAGCSAGGADDSGAETGSNGSAALPAGAVAELAERVPDDLREQGYWDVAGPLNAPPVGYVDESGELVGSEVEMVQAISKVLGLEARITTPDFSAVLPGIDSGRYDAGFPNINLTAEREEIYDMISGFQGGFTVLVKPGTPAESQITTDRLSLCGLTLADVQGDIVGTEIEKIQGECEEAGKPGIDFKLYPNINPSALVALQSGQADGVMSDLVTGGYFQHQEPEKFALTPIRLMETLTGGVFKKGSPLAPLVVDAMNHLIEEGTYGEIYEKYGISAIAIEKSELNPSTS
jgi:polar amino acid transport system substrate-binding protein